MPILQQAKHININLSKTLEQQMSEINLQTLRSQWLAENQSALDEYNRRIESRGVFSDSVL